MTFRCCTVFALLAVTACTQTTINNYYGPDTAADTAAVADASTAKPDGADAATADTTADTTAADSAPAPDIAPTVDAAPAPDAVADTAPAPDSAADTTAPAVDAAPKPDAAAGPLGPDDWPIRAVAPFVDATLYPVIKLADIAKATGQLRYALGFVVAKTATACEASWGTYYSIEAGPDSWDSGSAYTLYEQLTKLRTMGGGVMVSFGGASSVPLHVACTDATSLAAQYQAVIDKLALRRIDFDIEGTWVLDAKANARNSEAIVKVQAAAKAKGKPIGVWYTLPVLPNGLTAEGVAIVDDALSHGVEIGGVNVMAMDYGDGAAPNPAGKMGTYAIAAMQATHDQLQTLWTKYKLPTPPGGLWSKIGGTPMIGLNDLKSELFSLADAAQLAKFALDNGVGLLSMWSLNRDHPCADNSQVQLKCSSCPDQKGDFEFTAALQKAL